MGINLSVIFPLVLTLYFLTCFFSAFSVCGSSDSDESKHFNSGVVDPNPNVGSECCSVCENLKDIDEENLGRETCPDDNIWSSQLQKLLKMRARGSQKDQGLSAPRIPKSCSDAMEMFPSPHSKRQVIYPHGNSNKNKINTGLQVLCDFEVDDGGWTLIQKRSCGPREEFNRNWTDYVEGFGSLDGNFWLGLENIHALTKNRDQELRIELEDFEGEKAYAKYSSFFISDALDFYRLSLGGFCPNSTAGDSMTGYDFPASISDGMKFSTRDKDNDHSYGNCGKAYSAGGGWFGGCFVGNLNGLYREKGEPVPDWNGLIWYSWKYHKYSLAKTEMKIRTRKSETENEFESKSPWKPDPNDY